MRAAWLALLAASCAFDARVDASAVVRCGEGAPECPLGWSCQPTLGRCVLRAGAGEAVRVLMGEVTPAVARRGAVLRASLTASGPLAGPPRVRVLQGARALDFVVDVTLTDRASGAILRRVRVLDRAEFRSPVGETEASATTEAASDLARKIVLALEADF